MLIENIIKINGIKYKHFISELRDGDKLVKSPYKMLQQYGTGKEFTEVLEPLNSGNIYVESDWEVSEKQEENKEGEEINVN